MTDIDKESALRWFLAGFGTAAEGWNPDVLTGWNDEDHPVREDFEEMWPKPRHRDEVRSAEETSEFEAKVARHGVFASLPKISTETGREIPPFAGTRDEPGPGRTCWRCGEALSLDIEARLGTIEKRYRCSECGLETDWVPLGDDPPSPYMDGDEPVRIEWDENGIVDIGVDDE